MANISYSLIGKQIYCEFTISRENKHRKKTGFVTNPDDWKTKRSSRKNKDGKFNRIVDLLSPSTTEGKKVKKLLDDLEANVLSQHNEDLSKGIDINGNWLSKAIERATNQDSSEEQLFTYQMQIIIDNAPTRRVKDGQGGYKIGVSESRVRELKTFRNMVKRFETEVLKGDELKVIGIVPETILAFESWVASQGYAINYIGKMTRNFKSALNLLDSDFKLNIDTSKDIKVVNEKKDAGDIIYLNLEELQAIEDVELPNNYLKNARKWLIMGCFIGQRASDLLKLSEDEIKTVQGRRVFQIRQDKTRIDVTVPLLPEVENAIKDGFPHPISQAKLREYFKEICRLAEIDKPTNGRVKETSRGASKKGVFPKWRLIGTHVCRRSFASNHYGKISTAVLKGITGHATEGMFLRYIGKSSEDLAMQMFDYADKVAKD